MDPAQESSLRHLRRGALGLAGSSILIALFGLPFWLFAARLYDIDDFGVAATLVNAMIGLSVIANLNAMNGVPLLLRHHSPRTVVHGYAGAVMAVAALVGVTFVGLAPLVSDALDVLQTDAVLSITVAASFVAWSLFVVQDASLASLRSGHVLPVENGSYVALRLVAVIAFALLGSRFGVFYAWVVPLVVVLPVVVWFVVARAIPRFERMPDIAGRPRSAAERPGVWRKLGIDYVTFLVGAVVMGLLPLLVLADEGEQGAALFAPVYTSTSLLLGLTASVSIALLVEGSIGPERVPFLLRRSVRSLAITVVPLSVGLAVAAPLVLRVFGALYTAAAGTMALFVLAIPCRAVVLLAGSIARVRGRYSVPLGLEVAMAVVVLGLARPLLDRFGLVGVGYAWMTAALLGAVLAVPVVWRALRPTRAPWPPPTLVGGRV